jgi:subtilisin family serine protease
MDQGAIGTATRDLYNKAGVTLSSINDFKRSPEEALQIDAGAGLVFDDLGIAVLNAQPDQIGAMGVAVASNPAFQLVEPERVVYAMGDIDLSYLRGYRDAVVHLVDRMLEGSDRAAIGATGYDENFCSWALQATGVDRTRLSGRSMKVAILDTGLDLGHPDFAGRSITSQSFVAGIDTAHDGNGHGTHCTGLACGPERPGRPPRYGIAYEAEIFIGKVLNDAGHGDDGSILSGLQWAITNGCQVISMSLGAKVAPGVAYSRIFEQAAKRALEKGSLIIAAAGNDSRRPGQIWPVSHPANCPSIVAVAAVDRKLLPARFSNGGVDQDGKQIDIAAPGVDVPSSWPSPTLYREESGTSMATPIVAGIAALFAGADPNSRGRALLAELLQAARRTASSAADVGMGIVQAPKL